MQTGLNTLACQRIDKLTNTRKKANNLLVIPGFRVITRARGKFFLQKFSNA